MKKLLFIFYSLFFLSLLNAEIIFDSEYKYSLDLPEGFILENTTDSSLLFTHPNISVQLVIKISPCKNITSKNILIENLQKLNASFEIDEVIWGNSICSIANFSMKLGTDYKGWAVSSPLASGTHNITVLAYTTENSFEQCQSFIISAINSLSISEETDGKPGIFLDYAFPSSGQKKFSTVIGEKKIQSSFDKSDAEANQFLIEMEFNVFKLYVQHKLWKEAWKRYYRLVFRDTYGRFEKLSNDIFISLYPDCIKENKDNPEIAMLTKLLSWVQNFSYERNQVEASTDLTSPVMAVLGAGNDCDSRSLILCSVMQSYGIDSVLLISKEYRHAMAAFNIPEAQGQKIDTGHGEYIMCETTAKVTPGIIAKEVSDRKKWIIVE